MSARRSLSGIEGVISELLKAHNNMANAINAALGGSVYNIVTTDERSAREAIRFLKKNRSGRCNVLTNDCM